MHVEELHRAAERRAVRELPHSGNGPRGAGRVHDRRGTARPDGRARGAPLLQPAQVGVRDEPLGVGARDHDRADALIGLGAGDQGLQVGGDLWAELAARTAMEPGEEHSSSLLDFDSEAVVLGHRGHAAGLSLSRRDGARAAAYQTELTK